ncbi:FAD-dependent monooxygenase [Haloferax namakaokahaiae]|uniref:FAD-dependent monooxygenase n=1 Tax=Haloferax namakaokahaiae TaxID=1748331 RepID=A0ABD5ZDE5_9EURY
MNSIALDTRITDDAHIDFDYDVVVVGGGPTGCSAGIFTARHGLDTVIFDRGNAALKRAAYIENYLGFPGGIHIETLYDLMHDHARDAGCAYVPDMVEAVTHADGDSDGGTDADCDGFVVETTDGERVTTRYVVAASWYDGEYMRPLGGDEMFEEHDHGDGEVHEHFDPDYSDEDGRTPIDGLYVAAPAGERNAQAIVAAGTGAHVARCLLEDYRRELGFPEAVTAHYDWLRRESELSGEWATRDRWREWFHAQLPEDDPAHDYDEDADYDERLVELREAYLDRAFRTQVAPDEVEARWEEGQDRLLDYIDDERILERARRLEADSQSDEAATQSEEAR